MNQEILHIQQYLSLLPQAEGAAIRCVVAGVQGRKRAVAQHPIAAATILVAKRFTERQRNSKINHLGNIRRAS